MGPGAVWSGARFVGLQPRFRDAGPVRARVLERARRRDNFTVVAFYKRCGGAGGGQPKMLREALRSWPCTTTSNIWNCRTPDALHQKTSRVDWR